MQTSSEPAELVACREQVEALFASDDPAGAEVVLRSAVETWPERLGLRLKLARSLEEQGRMDEARASVEAIVRDRDALPAWSREMIAHFGFAIASGVKLDISHDSVSDSMKHAFISGRYEHKEAEMLAEVLRPNDVILEVGGGIGFIAAFTKLAEPTATVVSYEANPALMTITDRTKDLNGVDFDVRNAMLGEHAGTADFFVNKAFWASSATHDYGGASVIQVPMEAVDDAMAEQNFNVVVMDIEGGEIELVPMMDLRGVDRFVLETHPKLTGKRAVQKMLLRLRMKYGLVSAREKNGVHLLVRQNRFLPARFGASR